jgi:hypothetical protein
MKASSKRREKVTIYKTATSYFFWIPKTMRNLLDWNFESVPFYCTVSMFCEVDMQFLYIFFKTAILERLVPSTPK